MKLLFYLILLWGTTQSCVQREADKPILAVEGHLLRGPYLQMATDSGICVVFYTDSLLLSELSIQLPDGRKKTFSTRQAATKHIYKISGIQPGNTYPYSITIDGTSYSGEHWHFRTAPGTDDSGISFWAIGDFGAGNENQRRVRHAFQEYLTEHPVDFWLWLGDNAYPDGTFSQFHNKVFDRYYGYDS